MWKSLVLLSISLSMFSGISLEVHAVSSGYTYSHACSLLSNHRDRFSRDSQTYREIDQFWDAECRRYSWLEQGGNKIFPQPTKLNSFISIVPPSGQTEAPRTPDADSQSPEIARRYENCKNKAVRAQLDCTTTVQRSLQGSIEDYRALSSRISSAADGASLENACLSISSHESNAQSAIRNASQICDNYNQQCRSSCDMDAESLRQELREVSPSIQQWIWVDKDVAEKACSSMSSHISEAQSQLSAQAQNLRQQCASGHQRMQEDEQAMDKNLMNQAGQALQMLSQELVKGEGAAPMQELSSRSTPYEVRDMGSVDSPMVSVGKGRYQPSAPPKSDGALSGSGMEPPGDYKASRRKLMGAPVSSGAGVGGSFSKNPPGKADSMKNRRAQSNGSLEVLNGYYNESSTSKRLSGGGFSDLQDQSRGVNSRFGRNPAQKGNSADLTQFLPTRLGLRQNSLATGADGITGPHTDLFKKVRTRYTSVFINWD